MDLRTLSVGERIAAVGGAALFGLTFTSWLENSNAWQLFDIVDVLLALLALAAAALPLAKAMGSYPRSPASISTNLTQIGIITLTVTAVFLIEGEGLNVGIFLAVLASAAILYGGVTAPGSEQSRRGATPGAREWPRRRPVGDHLEQPPRTEGWQSVGDREQGAALGDLATARTAPTRQRPLTRQPSADSRSRGERAQPTNVLAVVSLAFGILWLYWLGSLIAVITGHIARRQIRDSHHVEGGDVFAVVGLALGWVGLGVLIVILLVAAGS